MYIILRRFFFMGKIIKQTSSSERIVFKFELIVFKILNSKLSFFVINYLF